MVLSDLYQRLLLMDLEFALDKKVERDLWNIAFKNVIDSLQGTQDFKVGEKLIASAFIRHEIQFIIILCR